MLGVGLSHFPGFANPDEQMSLRIKQVLSSDKVPPELRGPNNWPEPMRREWGDDEGAAFAGRHRQQFVQGVRKIRQAIDDFRPDAVVIVGDDQYENFREDLVPPFCIYIVPKFALRPYFWTRVGTPQPNVWGESREHVFEVDGQPQVARFLARACLEAEFDMSYAYRVRDPEGDQLGHAFNFTLAYLDYDRKGWPHPIIPLAMNAYGSGIIRNRGLVAHLFGEDDAEADPPAPSPKRCFELGQALARALKASPWRTVLVGTSSWSHAFLTAKHHYVYPDVDTDRQRFEALRAGDYLAWRDIPLEELEDAGEHELLNWMPLVGAMHELGQQPSYCEFLESWTMNSCKCSAIFPPA
ncbi:MAG TPA: extradiol ring-cleavage dioxygenase [Chloroflexota bacterium]